jgi:iron transport multicopper oxidase
MLGLSVFSALLSLSLVLQGQAATVRRTLNIVNREFAPDGFSRPTVLANGIYPGPLITGNKGDNFKLNVANRLTDNRMLRSTSIHWHGFFQAGTSWADGPSFVNQCPIAANHSFLYDFNVPDQAGTFWYHSHLSTQYCDGLRGAFIVYDPRDPLRRLYDVDDASTVITLTDWYHVPAPSAGKFPTPDSTLINGKGRFNNAGNVDTSVELAVVSVRRGTRYRMRLVSLSCDPNYIFSIDNHMMTIIEADGILTDPLTVDSIQIFAAQRYSFILNANQAVGNYWIRAQPNLGDGTFVNGLNSAILRYNGAPRVEPTTPEVPSVNPMREENLHTFRTANPGAPGGPAPGAVDVPINLDLQFDLTALEFTVNSFTYRSPSVPVLLQILSGASDPRDFLPEGSVISLPGNSVVEVSIPGGVIGGGHPFHLHGHVFDVIRSAGSTTYNYVNPVKRDVVNIGVLGDNVTIRFVTDNPGPWFLHCHIDWHLDVGLAVVFAEDVPRIPETNPVPDAWKELCPIYDSLSPDQL